MTKEELHSILGEITGNSTDEAILARVSEIETAFPVGDYVARSEYDKVVQERDAEKERFKKRFWGDGSPEEAKGKPRNIDAQTLSLNDIAKSYYERMI